MKNPSFKNQEDFLCFLKSIENDPNDDAPELRKFITRLYNNHSMPSFNNLDLYCVCQKSCKELSEDYISEYLLRLFDIEFLLYTDDIPTKVLETEILSLVGKKSGSYYLNVDFYKPERIAGSVPNAAHGDEIYKEGDS